MPQEGVGLEYTSTGHSTQKPVEGILSTGVSVSAPKQEPKESPVRSDHDIAQADHWPVVENATGQKPIPQGC